MDDAATPPVPDEVRILIVDDDPYCVKSLLHLLEAQPGTRSFGYTDPEKALAEFATTRPDVVLLDWYMEGLSGHQFLQTLLARFGAEEAPPVIVMTGDILPETRRQALEAGAADFLTKPLDQYEVTLRIRNHLRLRRLHQHVQSENQRLEETVQARTAELHQTIAELKEVQQQVIAEERMRALAVMAGGVAHDFNNALMVIRGYSELYSEGLERKPSREEIRKAFEIIALAAHDAGEIVRRLREFYRPFSDQGDERKSLDLNNLLKESLELAGPKWRTQCQARGVCVTIEQDLRELPPITAAPAEIREVMLNLIFNAVDAMPQGGRINLRTFTAGGEAIIEIEDTGTGMTPETRTRCLEPFYSTKGEKGTGLGLAITYGIIQRHGGSIKIRTELNQGTCFSVALPLRVKKSEVPNNIVQLPTLHHLRVLVVDDDPNVCTIISHLLEEDEHRVTVAASGCEALEKLHTQEYDLVITDRVMPKMSGDQLAVAIRELRPAEPIILLTGYEGRGTPREVSLQLSKPATMGSIRDAISRVMASPLVTEASGEATGPVLRRSA